MAETKKLILLAEDDPLIRKTCAGYLTTKGYKVIEAENGEEALDLFRKKEPDVLVTDLRMPGLDGMQLIRKVVVEKPDTPVIIVSGMGTMGDVIEALRAGAWDYLTKPIADMAILQHSISKALKHEALIVKEKQYKTSLEDEVQLRTIELLQHNQMLEKEMKRRQGQEQLVLQAKKEWERTIDAIPDMIALIDKNKHIIRMNRSLQLCVGINYEKILGEDLFQCLPSGIKLYQQTIKDGLSHSGEFYEKQLDAYLEITTIPYSDPDGELIGVVYIAKDITKQIKEQQNYARLFESSRDAIVVTNKKGFINCNQAALEMFGYSTKSEFLKLHPADVSPTMQSNGALSREAAEKHIKDSINDSGTFFRWEHKRKDGSVFPAEVLLSPFDQGGEVVVQGVVRDQSERQQADKEKEKLNTQLLHAHKLESVGQLAAGIAHEINTPAQFIGTNIDFLDEATQEINTFMQTVLEITKTAPKEIAEALNSAIEEMDWEYLVEEIPLTIEQSLEGVKRVTSIVRAMKEFSHPGSKEKAIQSLNAIVNTTITVARNEWKYVADVELDLDPDLPQVPLLADEMGQVILNMLVNAAHAIGEKLGENPEGVKGSIRISTRKIDKGVELRIQDTGAGMPEKVRLRIFDPFYTTKQVGKGTGQGLAISHDVIVEKHTGTIVVESRPGEGTTFCINLPLSGEKLDD